MAEKKHLGNGERVVSDILNTFASRCLQASSGSSRGALQSRGKLPLELQFWRGDCRNGKTSAVAEACGESLDMGSPGMRIRAFFLPVLEIETRFPARFDCLPDRLFQIP